MHITEEELDGDIVSRLIIREDMDGEKGRVTIERSSVVGMDGNAQIVVKAEGDKPEELQDFFQDGKQILDRYDVDSVQIHFTSIRDDKNYLFPGPVLILTGVRAKKGSEEMDLAPESLPSLAAFFGMVCIPQYNVPASLLIAIEKKQKGKVNSLFKRIRKWPSQYGVAEHAPKFYLCLGQFKNPEERDLRWDI